MSELLPGLVHGAVLRNPDTVAVRSARRQITYAELACRADALAALLRVNGVGPDTVVAVLHDRSEELPVALLGVLTSGGAFLPLDVAAPRARLAAQLESTGVSVGVADERHRALLDGLGLRVLGVPRALAKPGPVASCGTPRSLAYVICTSGSTGRPKAVMIENSSIASHVRWMVDAFPLKPGDEVLQVAPMSFDASITEFFWPLCAGATLRVLDPGEHQDLAVLDRVIANDVRAVRLPPTYLAEMLGPEYRMAWPGLRYLISGGEPLSCEVRDELLARLPNVRLVNRYGPTEATVAVTYANCVAGESDVALGTARPGITLRVLGPGFRAISSGEVGELFIAGNALARGYLGDPGATAESFLPDPIGPPGSRMYATGDLVRPTGEGRLVFAGRRDAQLKVRGIRVEPTEVEEVLAGHSGVRSCAVTVVGDAIAALIVPADHQAPPSRPALLRHARQWLPAGLLPSLIVIVDALPHTSRGKLDRVRLTGMVRTGGHARSAVADDRMASDPRDVIALVWEQLLGRRPLDPDENFFEIGGHSLLATRFQLRMRRYLGVSLPLQVIYDHPRYADIEAEILLLVGANIERSCRGEVHETRGR